MVCDVVFFLTSATLTSGEGVIEEVDCDSNLLGRKTGEETGEFGWT